MPENEFEQTMQHKLDALRLQPGEAVWEKVQLQLKKKEKKRRGLFFIFLLAGLLGAGGFIWMHMDGKNHRMMADTKKGMAVEAQTTHTASNQTVQKGQSDQPHPLNTAEVTTPNNPVEVGAEWHRVDASGNESGNNIYNKRTSPIKRKTKGKTTALVTAAEVGEEPEDPTNSVKEAKPVEVAKAVALPAPVTGTEEKVPAGAPVAMTDTLKKSSKTEIKDAVNSSKEVLNKKEQGRRWQVYLLVAAGQSAASRFFESANLQQGYLSDGTGLPATGNSGGNIYLPSVAKPAVGYRLGISVGKSLGKQVRLLTGLQYSWHRTSIVTGEATTTASGNIGYGYGSSAKYINQSHLLSLPLGLDVRLAGGDKHPLHLEMSGQYSRLLSTNTLSFSSDGIYVNDPSLFARSMAAVSGALLYDFRLGKTSVFAVGPECYYSFTPMSSRGLNKSSHYRFIGIRLQKKIF